jgi:DNA-binding beta-propeller fold protein YncE
MTVTLSKDYTRIVADRIRPLIYAHQGGTDIDVYNAYTATQVATVTSAAAALGQMAVSPDGSRLYALDTPSRSMSVIDLDTLTKVEAWPLDLAVDTSTSLLPIRPNGVEVVLVGNGRAYAQGRSLGFTPIAGSMTASDDGRNVFTQDTGISPATVAAFALDYSAVGGGGLSVVPGPSASFINGSSNGQDIAVRGDGRALYTASGAPYRCSSVDPTTLALVGSLPGGDAYPNNVEVTSDGRALCGISGAYATADFWVHSSAGVLLGSHRVSGYGRMLKTGQMVVTPDGLLVVVQTNDPLFGFVPIGAP